MDNRIIEFFVIFKLTLDFFHLILKSLSSLWLLLVIVLILIRVENERLTDALVEGIAQINYINSNTSGETSFISYFTINFFMKFIDFK